MPLAAGQTLNYYEILGPLGVGGMGEVYLARDTRLEREVAIKVLPEELADDEERLRRFEREAKTLASLNHPNVAGIHGVDQVDDVCFLALELVPGEDLAARISRGALPVDEAVDICRQIAEGLEAAHEAGVVHRDLKPANVRITPEGVVKILDFGLAKPLQPKRTAESGVTTAESDSFLMTEDGLVLGTPTYMSPEQARGKPVDRRTDIWAFGCVLYECLTGRRVFSGDSLTDVLAAIVERDPDWSQLPAAVPRDVRRLLGRCLDKDPRRRLRDVGEARVVLVGDAAVAGPEAEPGIAKGSNLPFFAGLIAASVAWLVVIATVETLRDGSDAEASEGAFLTDIAVSREDSPAGVVGDAGPLTLSPDGRRLATVVFREGEHVLSIYDFGTGSASILESTKGAGFPFWSPDSRWLGYFADGKLRKVEVRGGATQTLADAFAGRGGSWSAAGEIVFAPDIYAPLMKVSENGGVPTAVTQPASDETTHRNPYFLPDGERFLFIERLASKVHSTLMAGSVDGTAARELLENVSNVQLSAGHLLFVRDLDLVAQRFDEKSVTLSGPIVPIADNLEYWNKKDLASFSATPTGLLVFRRSGLQERPLSWFDRDGRLLERLKPEEPAVFARTSRDLQQVASYRRMSSGQGFDIWWHNVATRQSQRATFVDSTMLGCAFSQDGERMAISLWDDVSAEQQPLESTSGALWIQNAAGVRTDEIVLGETFFVEDWSPDDTVLLGWTQRTGTAQDITYVRLDEAEPRMRDLVRTPFPERAPSFSPGGKWVVYESGESGRMEVYVIDFPDVSRKWKVSRDGGTDPFWSQDGTEIFFTRSEERMTVTFTNADGGIEVGQPTALGLSGRDLVGPFGSDGERFLGAAREGEDGVVPLQVVRNWPALLER